jgi:S-adenosylmethionine:tRNA ribosyltransferase-isomerase
MLTIDDFDYNLPKELIAQKPHNPRDKSRLLFLDKNKKIIKHQIFSDLVDFLSPNDLLVVNDSKVFPARIWAKKASGGKVEVFLLNKIKADIWECLLKGKVKINTQIILSPNLQAEIIAKNAEVYLLKFNLSDNFLKTELQKIAKVPLPPYIKQGVGDYMDKYSYQTVYANEKADKSVAAPTAGLHFTNRLMKKITNKGVDIVKITLHVGLGTFSPVKVQNIKDHQMHSEEIIIKKRELAKIIKAKKNKKRIVAVGTTVCRSLESLARDLNKIDKKKDYISNTDIFIYPGYNFLMTDALLTNFHLPKSSLLMLVSALAGQGLIKQAYSQAILKKYRFFSYGDAMLIF